MGSYAIVDLGISHNQSSSATPDVPGSLLGEPKMSGTIM